MTRDHAIARAKAMRDAQAKMVKVAQDWRRPFGTRYEATIKAEDYDEAARKFDRFAERPLASGSHR